MEQDHLNLLTLRKKRTSQTITCHTAPVNSSWPGDLHGQEEREAPNSKCYHLQSLALNLQHYPWEDSSSMPCAMSRSPFSAPPLSVCGCSDFYIISLWNPWLLACILALIAARLLIWLAPQSLPQAPSAATVHSAHLLRRFSFSLLCRLWTWLLTLPYLCVHSSPKLASLHAALAEHPEEQYQLSLKRTAVSPAVTTTGTHLGWPSASLLGLLRSLDSEGKHRELLLLTTSPEPATCVACLLQHTGPSLHCCQSLMKTATSNANSKCNHSGTKKSAVTFSHSL